MIDDAGLVERLKSLDCCALSDALDKLELQGAVTGLRQESGAGRIAGRAVTVKLDTGYPPPGPPRHLGTTAIEMAGPDDVIVIEQRTGVEAGCWGGLLTLGAKVRGIAGVVADGPVRDIDEARSHGFPIFTNKTTCLTARSRVVEKATNEPIEIGNVKVSPGDYVAADNSAVIFIGSENIEHVLDTAEAIAAREAAMAGAIEAGTPISEVMGGNYEHMLDEKDG
ncbi:RraA family protein [Parasphingopyxis marina]|uniref:Putative 4-hydroxy-4-methyl-2-oxoglutarate aldolase n=1 Tax=Parasphingopyxis marina TaxID=2761622 RepID=A0A842I445_9SPHN|nr:RraA family protein [Parasphingopyxis marina]MBC2778904.1 RraA family protein [Parasphingopyxis marina]